MFRLGLFVVIAAFVRASVAFGLPMEAENNGTARDFVVALPLLSLNGESSAKFEFNLGGTASIAIEATRLLELEQLSDEVVDERGDSLVVSGVEGALLISRYTQGARLAGFYWTLGAGFMRMDASWVNTPDDDDPGVDFALADDQNHLHHEAELSGVTGHGRLGYRYVARELPFAIGGYLGLRHFQAGVEDRYGESDDDRPDHVTGLSDREREQLRRRFTTQFVPGLEFALAF